MNVQSISSYSLHNKKCNNAKHPQSFGANLVFAQDTGKEFINALKTSNPNLLTKFKLEHWSELLPFIRGAFYNQTKIVPGTVKISGSEIVGKVNISHSFPVEGLNYRHYNHSSGDATAKSLWDSLVVSTESFTDDVMHAVDFPA